MIVVDSSALVAILLQENEAKALIETITADPHPVMSAPTYVELFAVLERKLTPQDIGRFERLLDKWKIVVHPFTPHQAQLARAAYRDYGKGSGHKAGLNLGDTYSYALAKDLDVPLLFKGQDFIHTDLRPALVNQN
ncbi:MAG: type II toxin-antitoxin system VapC family toxin [Actinomycetaceae bacterium]|nr:type II toxin-antitoxin system VapC family toxin [Actinomycetaceae bacterium]